jgi:hypothetical protein
LSEAELVAQMQIQVAKLIADGALKGTMDEIIKDFSFDVPGGYISITMDDSHLGMTNHLNLVGASICPKYIVPEDQLETNIAEANDGTLRNFSMASIQERLRVATKNPKIRFRYTVLDYKKYAKAKAQQLSSNHEMATKFYNMFLTDMMGMIIEVMPLLEEGKQLGTLIGTSQVSPKLMGTARNLSRIYKRLKTIENKSGMINKNLYKQFKDLYSKFLTDLAEIVMPDVVQNMQTKENVEMKSKKYSYTEEGRISLFSTKKPRTFSLRQENEDEFVEACHKMAKDVLGDAYDKDVTEKTARGIWKDNDGDSDEKLGIFRNGLKS